MENFNLYEELGVTKTSSQDEIKTCYKKLALKWHPDKNKGNEEEATLKFQRISEAYSILSDPDKKARYDKYGTVREEDFDFQDFMSHMDFDDIFGGLFGGMGGMSSFTFSFGDMGMGMGGGKMGGKRAGRSGFVSKTQMRREKREAEKLMKEWNKMDFMDEKAGKSGANGKKKTKEEEEEEEWDTEEEYTDEEDTKKGGKGKEEEDDDDFEDVDSEEGDDGFGMDAEMMFLFPMFMDEKSVETGNKYKCKFDNKVFKDDEGLFEHFDKAHRKDFKVWMNKKAKK